jgi:hypothetical protein
MGRSSSLGFCLLIASVFLDSCSQVFLSKPPEQFKAEEIDATKSSFKLDTNIIGIGVEESATVTLKNKDGILIPYIWPYSVSVSVNGTSKVEYVRSTEVNGQLKIYFRGLTRGGLSTLNLKIESKDLGSSQPFQVIYYPSGSPLCYNGDVNAAESSNSHYYIGGTFTKVGACTGSTAWLEKSSGELKLEYSQIPRISGLAYNAVPDGNGGLFVLGIFHNTNGATNDLRGLIRVKADGTIDSSFSSIYGNQLTADFDGEFLHMGSWVLTNYGGRSFTQFATVNPNTGLPLASSPDFNNEVYGFARYNSGTGIDRMFIGGAFDKAGMSGVTPNITRNKFAAFDFSGGTYNSMLSYDPSPNGNVGKMLYDPSNNLLFISGAFTQFDGVTRKYLAAINPSTLALDSRVNFDLDNSVSALKIVGNRLFIGGSFTQIDGVPYSRLAAINLSSLSIDSTFNPQTINGYVGDLDSDGSLLYVTGSFTSYGATARHQVLSIDLSDNSLTSFAPEFPTSNPPTVAMLSGHPYFTGFFQSVNGTAESPYLANINKTTNRLELPVLKPNGAVYALTKDANNLYVAGTFDSANSKSRSYLSGISLSSETMNDDIDIQIGGPVYALDYLPTKNHLLIGGDFTSVSGSTNQRFAILDLASGVPFRFGTRRDFNSTVYDITHGDQQVYVAGDFTTLDSVTTSKMTSLNMSNYSATNYDFDITTTSSLPVRALKFYNGKLYVGGNFTGIGGLAQNYLARFNEDSSTSLTIDTAFAPSILALPNSERVGALDVNSDGVLLIGGNVYPSGNSAQTMMMAYDLNSFQFLSNYVPRFSQRYLYGSMINVIKDFGDLFFAGGTTIEEIGYDSGWGGGAAVYGDPTNRPF